MRLYTFCNYYLSSIQQGIQTAHLVAELFLKYNNAKMYPMGVLWDWARHEKTIVCLNGGNSKQLQDLSDELANAGCPYPWAHFKEDEQSLNTAATCVGIVLPEAIYGRPSKDATTEEWNDWHRLVQPTEFDMRLISILDSSQLAR